MEREISKEDRDILAAFAIVNKRAGNTAPSVFKDPSTSGAWTFIYTMKTLLTYLSELNCNVSVEDFRLLSVVLKNANLSEDVVSSLETICYAASRFQYEVTGFLNQIELLDSTDQLIEEEATQKTLSMHFKENQSGR